MKRTAIYLRVSTDGQTAENQRRELKTAAKRHGWQVVETFADEGTSGAKGRDKRPGLDQIIHGKNCVAAIDARIIDDRENRIEAPAGAVWLRTPQARHR